MRQRPQTILLLLILSTVSMVAGASERLHYRLSYSGLITSFFSKALADVSLNLEPEATQFRGKHACRISMEINTSAYTFAEMLHPVRYRWESTMNQNRQKTLIARAIDSGESDIHEVSWYDWGSGSISIFRKRREIDLNRNVYKGEQKLVWERDTLEPPAPFIDPLPPIKDGLSYLIQTGTFKETLTEPAIDPLAMIQRVRAHNFNGQEKLQMLVALDEELHHYQAHLIERPPLQVGNRSYSSTLKIEITRTTAKGRKGAMTMWLRDSPKQQPLRIDIKAALGVIRLELVSIEEKPGAELCSPLLMVQG